uniref:Transposase n=1 Tax=Echinococcus granulosus TaxID=6210 RepID=A0A068WWJ3_ECHGR|nr:transposase [Echinococcus granulosus]
MSLSNKRPHDTYSQCGAPYIKRVRNDATQSTGNSFFHLKASILLVNAFSQLLAPARRFYASLTGRPAIPDTPKETSPECSPPPLIPPITASQSTLTDFGFHRHYDNRIRLRSGADRGSASRSSKCQVGPIPTRDSQRTCHESFKALLINLAAKCDDTCIQQRVMMKFLVNEGIKPAEIYRRLQAQFKDEALSRSKTFEWCRRFKNGRVSIRDDPGRGGSRPTAIIPENIQLVERLILDNRRVTCREIARKTKLSVGTVNKIICKHLQFRKNAAGDYVEK